MSKLTNSETRGKRRRPVDLFGLAIVLTTTLFAIASGDPGDDETVGPPCEDGTWYLDDDDDGYGNPANPVTGCTQPVGSVDNADDNCPTIHNPDQADSDNNGIGDACAGSLGQCVELADDAVLGSWSGLAAGGSTTVALLAGDQSVFGDWALRAVTTSGGLAGARVSLGTTTYVDATAHDVLQLAVRGINSDTWQINGPVVILEDATGLRRTFSPTGQHLIDAEWHRLTIPLLGGGGWTAGGDAIDLGALAAIEILADTWGGGFTLDVDGVAFAATATDCPFHCQADCHGRGTCDTATLSCACGVGALGSTCADCGVAFYDTGNSCQLINDGTHTTWPNATSWTNGDPWLAVHHEEITRLEPKVLVIDFANAVTAASAAALVDEIRDGFTEASRPRGYDDLSSAPQLQYQLARTIVNLRDGVDGRPPAPADWEYLNSTLLPRHDEGEKPMWGFDYAALFNDQFANHYGFADPTVPGRNLTLCELIDQGLIHEVWVVAMAETLDDSGSMAEVLEYKQRYDASRNPIPGNYEACAGNGCFDSGVPHCGRSVRIGSINATRGPGCYLHSQGHGLERAGRARVVPALSDWFLPFARFDLDTRYGLPVQTLYELGCSDPNGDGISDPPCLTYPTATSALLYHGPGNVISQDPWDPACGNVHFTPNATWHYQTDNTDVVQSSCEGFGRHAGPGGADAKSPITSTDWSDYDQVSPDCGGGFMIWWFQNMPAQGSGQTFDDGSPMMPVWPFLFY